MELPACVALSILVEVVGGHPFLSELPKGDLHSADQGCSWVQIIALCFSACHRDILAICCKLSLMSRKSGLWGHSGCFSSAPGPGLTRSHWHVEIRSRRLLHFAGGTIVKTKSQTRRSVRVFGAQRLGPCLPGLSANLTAQIQRTKFLSLENFSSQGCSRLSDHRMYASKRVTWRQMASC